jgi:hypothetical protein
MPRSKRPRISKRVRRWYSVYREQCANQGTHPYPLAIWAALESERHAGTARGRELSRYAR